MRRSATEDPASGPEGTGPGIRRAPKAVRPDVRERSDPSACQRMVLRDGRTAKSSWARSVGLYVLKAVVLLASLFVIGNIAPSLPAFAFPFVFGAYALVATVGSMYHVRLNRFHRQSKYKPSGSFSQRNRKWVVRAAVMFVVYLVAALAFVLQAPSWDALEWALAWASAIAFLLVFLAARRISGKEYAPRYVKAYAIKWAIPVTTVIVTIAYAVLSLQTSSIEAMTLRQVIEGRIIPYQDSPCVLLSELDKLTTYMDYMKEYGLNQVSSALYGASAVVDFVLGLSVFFGVVSQLGCCLLSWQEARAEFELLPVPDDDEELLAMEAERKKGKVRKRVVRRLGARRGRLQDVDVEAKRVTRSYVIVLLAIWLGWSIAFVAVDLALADARETEEYTAIDGWIEETTEWAIIVSEHGAEEVGEVVEKSERWEEFDSGFQPRLTEYVTDGKRRMSDAIDAYYERCEGNAWSYVEWYDGFFGGYAKLFRDKGMAQREFEERIVYPVSTEELEASYEDYLDGLEDLYSEYLEAVERIGTPTPIEPRPLDSVASSVPQLALWTDWGTSQGDRFTQEVLLMVGEDASGDSVQDGIVAYIDDRRKDAIASIDLVTGMFFPSQALTKAK